MVDVQVWWAALTHAHAGLAELLDPTEHSRLTDLELPADRARFLLGAALLRTAVARATGAAPAEVRIDRTCEDCGAAHGRPRIAGGPHVSVSHSGVLVVVATCLQAPVGIDVQRVAQISEQDAAEWTRREACFKACGVPPQPGPRAAAPLPSTTIDLDAPRPGYAAALTIATTDPPQVQTVNLDAGPL